MGTVVPEGRTLWPPRKDAITMSSRGRSKKHPKIVPLAVLLALASAGCDAEPKVNESFVVESLDGAARLAIPAAALPRGTSPSEVTLTRIPAGSLEPLVPRHRAAVAYELGPDGLELEEPATLTVRIAAAENKPYLVAHVSRTSAGTRIETPEPTWARIPAAEASTYTHEVRISAAHFSRVEVLEGEEGLYSADVQIDAHDTVVGGTAAVGLSGSTITGALEMWMGCVAGTTESSVFVRSWSSPSALSPMRIDHLDPPSPDVGATFRPQQPGAFSVNAELSLGFVTQRTCAGETLPTPWWVPVFNASTPIHQALAVITDAILDYIDSVSTGSTTFESTRNDLQSHGAARYTESLGGAAARFNDSVLECGEIRDDGTITVCPTGVLDVPEGDVYVVTSTMTGPLPSAGADEGHHYVYGLVFESNGLPDDDWVFVPPYDWDYFLGTDRWYQLAWNPTTAAWTLDVSQVDATQAIAPATSSVRAAIHGDTVTWFVPASELPAAQPTYRVTAFGHDGAYSASDRGGDVSGADPTEALTPLP